MTISPPSWRCRAAGFLLLHACLAGCLPVLPQKLSRSPADGLSTIRPSHPGAESPAMARQSFFPSNSAEIVSLGSRLFSVARGKSGYWSPARFLEEIGAHIYTTERYDPAKTPILFVHGAAGTPRDWRFFVTHLDRRRYQPWFYYYPSGASVEDTARQLYQRLVELREGYNPSQVYITAHSLGGLVVRFLLAEHGDSLPWIKLFVSISTPWGGEPLTTLGVSLSPIVVPSWDDLRPRGAFLKELFAKPLPAGLDYYLFFGHRGSRSLIRPNNDGTVTLASMLRQEAQAEAKAVYGFDESHTSILSSAEVLAKFNALLSVAAETLN